VIELSAGQEASTIDFDGETKITPFNMKEELEEGHFDAQGTYVWNKKDASEIRDSWLDSIDWVKVRKPEGGKEGEELLEMEENVDVLALYKELLDFLQKGETVLRAVKRLGR
jgi:CD2 antigen cytoplasmic tail-binding protein 2